MRHMLGFRVPLVTVACAALWATPWEAESQERTTRLDQVFHGLAYRPASAADGADSPPGGGSADAGASMAISPHDASVRYRGGTGIERSTDGGETWEAWSPALVPSGLASVVESPLEPGLVWAGGRDGSVHLTRDGGLSWTRVRDGSPEVTVVALVASEHDGGTAFLVESSLPGEESVPGPGLLTTEDYGASWSPISSGIPDEVAVTAFAADPESPGLLFAGTDEGVFVSFNEGASWDLFRAGMPEAAVVHLRIDDRNLRVETRSHGPFVLDEIAPFRHVVRGLMTGEPFLLEPPPVYVASGPPAPSVYLDYLLPSFVGSVRLEVTDGEGTVVMAYDTGRRDAEGRRPAGSRAGVHRVTWDLTYESEEGTRRRVEPGMYTVRMNVDGLTKERTLEVVGGAP